MPENISFLLALEPILREFNLEREDKDLTEEVQKAKAAARINGFLLPIFKGFVWVLFNLNLIEWLKRAGDLLPVDGTAQEQEQKLVARKNDIIDGYMVAKWVFVIWALVAGWSGAFVFWAIWYLIASNLFGYFYYHAWKSVDDSVRDADHQKRRFLNFILSIAFYLVCYAQLYAVFFVGDIGWPSEGNAILSALQLSVANAFTLTYGDFMPLNQVARLVFMSELINTFFFFTIIVANSIPQRGSGSA